MADTQFSFKPNDYLVDYGEVYQITQIKHLKDAKGKNDTYLYYKSFFPSKTHQDLFCSIPVTSLVKTTTRKPITKAKATSLLRDLSGNPPEEVYFEDLDVADILKQNDIEQTLHLIKVIWHDKQDPETNFSSTKKQAFDDCLNQVIQELALVLKLSPPDARKKLFSRLKASQ